MGRRYKVIGINTRDIINTAQAANTIGITSHGCAAQTAHANYAVFVLSPQLICSTHTMKKLAANGAKDPTVKSFPQNARPAKSP